MVLLTFVTSFTGILHCTWSMNSLLNGVSPNDAPVSQIITVVQGSWYLLEPRIPNSKFARYANDLMWLAWVACWVLEINYLSLAFSSVPLFSWKYVISLRSIVKSLEPQKLFNFLDCMGSLNLKWESPENLNSFMSSGLFNSYLITCQLWWWALDLGFLLLLRQ